MDLCVKRDWLFNNSNLVSYVVRPFWNSVELVVIYEVLFKIKMVCKLIGLHCSESSCFNLWIILFFSARDIFRNAWHLDIQLPSFLVEEVLENSRSSWGTSEFSSSLIDPSVGWWEAWFTYIHMWSLWGLSSYFLASR